MPNMLDNFMHNGLCKCVRCGTYITKTLVVCGECGWTIRHKKIIHKEDLVWVVLIGLALTMLIITFKS
jgi:hypothetical protein